MPVCLPATAHLHTQVRTQILTIAEMCEAVELPPEEDAREWVAFNLCYFAARCEEYAKETESLCIGCFNNVQIGPNRIPYASYFVQEQLLEIRQALDANTPKKPCEKFPSQFDLAAQNASAQLLLVLGHLNEHRDALQNPALFDSVLTHFGCFVREHGLVPEANFLLVDHIRALDLRNATRE